MSIAAKFCDSPEEIVSTFYKACGYKDYAVAFDCFTPEFQQERWDGTDEVAVERFADGYFHTKKIFNVVPTVVKEKYGAVTVSVHYEEITDVLLHPFLNNSQEKASLLDWAKVGVEGFNNFMVSELNVDIDRIRQIPIEAYFGENNVETVLWHAGVKPENYNNYVETEEKEFAKARQVFCTKTSENGWKISSIQGYVK